MRTTKFQTGNYYHIYNRGVDRRVIFEDQDDFIRFIRSMREFKLIDSTGGLYYQDYKKKWEHDSKCPIGHLESLGSPHLVNIICYVLLDNHFHLMLKQLTENGISLFMQKLMMGHTKHFNYKYYRTGSLFGGTFKAVHIKINERLLCLSGYINGNPEIHGIARADTWPWSSYGDYLGIRKGTLCNKKNIISQFSNSQEYRNYVNMVISDSIDKKKSIRDYLLE